MANVYNWQLGREEAAPPLGGDAAGWVWDPAGIAMSRQAKSQEY